MSAVIYYRFIIVLSKLAIGNSKFGLCIFLIVCLVTFHRDFQKDLTSLFLVGIFSWDISALCVALNQPGQIAKPVQQDQPIQLAQPVKASWFDPIEKNYLLYSI